jgi:hypothetical protein
MHLRCYTLFWSCPRDNLPKISEIPLVCCHEQTMEMEARLCCFYRSLIFFLFLIITVSEIRVVREGNKFLFYIILLFVFGLYILYQTTYSLERLLQSCYYWAQVYTSPAITFIILSAATSALSKGILSFISHKASRTFRLCCFWVKSCVFSFMGF